MRCLPGILTAAALLPALATCGSSSTGSGTQPPPNAAATTRASTAAQSNFSTHNNDRDNDGDHNDDDNGILRYGRSANAADRQASVSLLEGYYAAAAAENGARACQLLVPFIAESVAEDDGHSPQLRGNTCAAVMTKLFRLRHRMLAQKSSTLKILDVRVEGDKALAILDFPKIPEVREISERRVGATWKVLELLDGILE